MARISGGPNKQGVGKFLKMKYAGEGWKFGITVQQPAQIKNTPVNIAVSKYFLESCHIHLIHYLGNSTKDQFFCRFLLEKLKIQ